VPCKLDALIAQVPLIDFDNEIAEQWAALFTTLSRAGQRRRRARFERFSAGRWTLAFCLFCCRLTQY